MNSVTRLWKSQEAIQEQRIKSSSKGAVYEMAWVKMATGEKAVRDEFENPDYCTFNILREKRRATQDNSVIFGRVLVYADMRRVCFF